jgi:hypothetical protein
MNISNFEINILCVCKTEDENILEILLIKEHKTYWQYNGYTLTRDAYQEYKHNPKL